MATSTFPLQNAIKKILDNPSLRPELTVKSTATEGSSIVGDDNFSESERYGKGIAPRIAMNLNNVAVEVHQSENEKTLWYSVGSANGSTVNFGESHKYDKGIKPSVAVSRGGLVVEVHQSENESTLWYRVGVVEGSKIRWTNDDESIKYDNGERPSVAITDNELVIEVHKSQSHDTLWYRFGQFNGSTIDWEESREYDDGIRPSVAITNDGLVVEVHQSQNHDTLWSKVGRRNGMTIDWGESVQYDKGKRPSVAVTHDGLAIEVHESQSKATLWYRIGSVEGKTIDWSESRQYGGGSTPGVACNGKLAVETHSSSQRLSSSVLTLPALIPGWYLDEGENSYLYVSMEGDSGQGPSIRTSTKKSIMVEAGAPFLLANLTSDSESTAFPKGAELIIQSPDGVAYGENFDEYADTIKVGASLQSLVVKDPIPGEYLVVLTVPPQVPFFFAFATLPSENVAGVLLSKQKLTKRRPNKPNGSRALAIGSLAAGMLREAARRRQQRFEVIMVDTARYVTHGPTREELGIADPLDIVDNIRELNPNYIITPPADPVNAPVENGPVIEYVQNEAGAVQWLHARITQDHLDRGTETNLAMRTFVRRLGLQTDQAGHIIANRLGGLGTVRWNIFPQNPRFNAGVFRADVEDLIYQHVRNNGPVEIWFRFDYDDWFHPNRPSRISYYIVGEGRLRIINDLANPERIDGPL